MKRVQKALLLVGSIAMMAGAVTFGAADLRKNNNKNTTEEVVDFGGLKATPFEDRYTDTWSSEPIYSSNQKSFMYSHMNLGNTWKNYQGNEGKQVTVAVIDTGLDIYHEDFLTSAAKNVTITESNVEDYSIIDPKSCYIYDKTGYGSYTSNCVTEVGIKKCYDDDTYDSTYKEYYSHGTASASCIGAAINGVGGIGVAPKVNLLIIKMDFFFNSLDVAIRYAANNGADVINMSLGAYSETFTDGYGEQQSGSSSVASALTSAINYALSKDCVVVAAAGNENTNHKSYPACNAGVIGVGALARNSSTSKATFSNYNLTTDTSSTNNNVDVMAPGYVHTGNVNASSGPNYGTSSTNKKDTYYCETQGTSFASPLTAGAVALARSKYPDLSHTEIENRLIESCVDMGNSGWDSTYGYGRVDITNLLSYEDTITGLTLSKSSLSLYSNGNTAKISGTVMPENASNKTIRWTSSNSSVVTLSSNTSVSGNEITVTPHSTGSATITATCDGDSSISQTCSVTVSDSVTLTGVTLKDGNNQSSSSILRGGTVQLNPTLIPSNATEVEYILVSDNEAVATVSDDGLITAVGKGTTTITMAAEQGSNEFDAEYTITVTLDGNLKTVAFDLYDSTTVSDTSSTSGFSLSDLNGKATIDGVSVSGVLQSFSGDKNYKRKGGLALSSGSNNGHVILNFSSTYPVESVSITAAKIDSGGALALSYKSSSASSYTNATSTGSINNAGTLYANCTNVLLYESLGGANSIKIQATNRVVIFKIEVDYIEAGTPTTKTLSSIAVTGMKTSYTKGETFSFNGTCTATYSDGTTGTVTPTSVSSPDMSTIGTKTVTVTYTLDGVTKTTTYDITVSEGIDFSDYGNYYSTISSSAEGSTLLTALRTLNLAKRTSTVGYSNMGTSTSGSFKYTDYDPNYVQYDSNGKPYGTKILSFYSGESVTSFNREHVWPNSRGGGSGGTAGTPYPDADIFMPRPTSASENSSRGNSVYVTDMNHSSDGWDPVKAFGANNVYTGIRGECARIIFYCMTVNSNLVLNENTSNSGNNMGLLTDLLEWNRDNPVNDRELRRQYGGQYLQGNRNAFVDHPDYACKIWGNTSDATREICGISPVTQKTLSSISYTGTPKLTYNEGDSFDPTGLTVTATYSDGTTANVTSSVVWTPSTLTTSTTSVTGTYTEDGVTKTVTIYNVVVNEVVTTVDVTGVTLNKSSTSLTVGGTETLVATVAPDNATNKNVTWSSSDSSVATVNDGVVTAVSAGTSTITVSTVDKSKTATCLVTVTAASTPSTTSYSLEFKTNSSDGSSALNTSVLDEASSNTLLSEITSSTKAYAGKNGLKLGSSGSAGNFTGTLVASAQSSIIGIEVYTEKYGSDNSTISWTIGNNSGSAAAGTTIKSNFLTPISGTTIQINSTLRAYITKVVLTVGTIELDSITASIDSSYKVYVGDTLDTSKITVTGHCGSNSDAVTGWTYSGFDSSVAGTNKITISYTQGSKTLTCELTLNILENTLNSITVACSKTYKPGDTFSYSDLTVTGKYAKADAAITDFTCSISNGYMFTFGDAPNKTIDVSYGGKTESITLTVTRNLYVAPNGTTKTINSSSFSSLGSSKTSKEYTIDSIKYQVTSGYYYSGKLSFGTSSQSGSIQNITAYSSPIKTVSVSCTTGGSYVHISISKDGTKWVNYSADATTSMDYFYVKIYSNGSTASSYSSNPKATTYTNISSFTLGFYGVDTSSTLADYLMESDTAGQCTTKFYTARTKFLQMTSEEQTAFKTSTDYVIATARERYEAWAYSLGENPYVNSASANKKILFNIDGKNNIALIAFVMFAGISSIGAYLFMRKRRVDL